MQPDAGPFPATDLALTFMVLRWKIFMKKVGTFWETMTSTADELDV
jgi:hypothetical protein